MVRFENQHWTRYPGIIIGICILLTNKNVRSPRSYKISFIHSRMSNNNIRQWVNIRQRMHMYIHSASKYHFVPFSGERECRQNATKPGHHWMHRGLWTENPWCIQRLITRQWRHDILASLHYTKIIDIDRDFAAVPCIGVWFIPWFLSRNYMVKIVCLIGHN